MTVQVPSRPRGPPSQDAEERPHIAAAPVRREQPPDPSIWRDERALRRAMAWFVVPQATAAALQLFSSTITVIYFGQLLGRSALAGASLFLPTFCLVVPFLLGMISRSVVVG